MTRETEFTTAGFVILKVVKKDVKLSFFLKKKEKFFCRGKILPTHTSNFKQFAFAFTSAFAIMPT